MNKDEESMTQLNKKRNAEKGKQGDTEVVWATEEPESTGYSEL